MEQQNMELDTTVERVEEYKFEPIKGYPMLNWRGKRPFKGTRYFPAQLKEVHGEDVNGWMNKIFWGDNIQVMSHLLKEYRGKVDLVYIDPPFDSKADYKKKIKLKGKAISNDTSLLEEKQYTDMWSNDEYLQFMYERIILIRELLSDNGSIFLHCDWHKSHHLRCLLDEVFGENNFVNEIIWHYVKGASSNDAFGRKHQTIFFYCKNKEKKIFNRDAIGVEYNPETIARAQRGEARYNVTAEELEKKGKNPGDVWKDCNFFDGEYIWSDVHPIQGNSIQNVNYPTQKPEALLERIIKAATNENYLVFDCFMGSGTTQAVAQKLGRRFIGADINLGAIQTTTKRLLKILEENIEAELSDEEALKTCGFEVYNVNNYDVFRNPAQAKELLIEALEIDPLDRNSYFDGMKDGKKVKIMPVNRIATKADVSDLITNLDYKEYEQTIQENPNVKVDDILLVCMGHDPEMVAHFKKESGHYNINLEVYDILKDGSELVFKRNSEAKIMIDGNELIIEQFYPNTLLEKLRQDGTEVEDWRETVESVMIDPYCDGEVFEPTIVDIPEKNELVEGRYEIPEDHGTVAIKITDLLSETYFEVINNG